MGSLVLGNWAASGISVLIAVGIGARAMATKCDFLMWQAEHEIKISRAEEQITRLKLLARNLEEERNRLERENFELREEIIRHRWRAP